MIGEILSQTPGPYRNKLEERHDEITDPAAWQAGEWDPRTPGALFALGGYPPLEFSR